MDQQFKFDKGKIQYRLIPPKALRAIAENLTYGAQKYAAHTWTQVEPERYLDAAYRHLESFRLGDRIDEESGLHHLAMAATNLMFLIEREYNGIPEDGRKVLTYHEEINKEVSKEGKKDIS